MEDNPMCIQYSPYENSRHATPLVLIHDGGGTIFPYLRLGSLNRDVWAIHDPNWSTSELYEGGLDEMAGIYIDFIKNVGIRGSILLGGKSLSCINRLNSLARCRMVTRWLHLSRNCEEAGGSCRS